MAEQASKVASVEPTPCIVTRKDLPLSCPTPAMELWNLHPRVYLPISETRHATCPYCGTEFVLQD
jgi:uncharacterized Zn-finger protein